MIVPTVKRSFPLLAAVLRQIATLVIPAAFPLLAAFLMAQQIAQPMPHEIARFAPVALFAVAFGLAWRFHMSRIAATVVLLATADQVVRSVAAAYESGTATGWSAAVEGWVGALLPLNLLLLAVGSERGAVGRWNLLKPFVLLAQVGLVAGGYAVYGSVPTRALHPEWLGWGAAVAGNLPHLAVITYFLAFAIGVALLLRRRSALEAGMVGTLLAAFLAFRGAIHSQSYSLYLGAAGLTLIIALVETSYGLAFRDELTRLPARRAFNDAIGSMSGRYAVAMVDIDHFKRINDRHGHDVGDQVLRMVARRIAGVRGGGRPFRYGGEEFAILFKGKSAKQAEPHLESLRREIANATFTLRGRNRPRRKPVTPRRGARRRPSIRVRVSIGAASRNKNGLHPDEVVIAADKLLYKAKKAGRNRLIVDAKAPRK